MKKLVLNIIFLIVPNSIQQLFSHVTFDQKRMVEALLTSHFGIGNQSRQWSDRKYLSAPQDKLVYDSSDQTDLLNDQLKRLLHLLS